MPFVPDQLERARFVPDSQPPTKGDAISASVEVPRRATESELTPSKPSAGEIMKSALSNIPSATDVIKTPYEVGASLVSGAVAPVGAGVVGAVRRLFGASPEQAQKTFNSVMESLQTDPKSPVSKSVLESLAKFMDVSKLGGLTPTLNPAKMPQAGRGAKSVAEIKSPIPVGAATEGAEAAINELQRQRGVIESGKTGPTLAAPSAVEKAMAKAKGASGELRDVFKNNTGKSFDVAAALRQVDQELSTTVDLSERAALNQVKETIQTALQNEKAGGGTVTQFPGYVLQGGKVVKSNASTPANAISLDALDNVRQSIKKTVDQWGAEGKPLGDDAQRRLLNVRDALVSKAPPEYSNAIAKIAETQGAIEPFTAEGSIRTKITADSTKFEGWTAADKQKKMNDVFSGTTPSGQVLSELVRDTQHDPKALQSVRNAYFDWLSPAKGMHSVPDAKAFIDNWEKTREAVTKSGLMTPEHADTFEKVSKDVLAAYQAEPSAIKRSGESIAYIAGSVFANKGYGAARGYKMLFKDDSRNIRAENALIDGMMKLSADPETAKLLASPPTPENIKKLSLKLPPDLAQTIVPMIARSAAQKPQEEKPSQKIANPFGATGVVK
jgi:hypothetical protein